MFSPDTYEMYQRHQEERALLKQREEVYEMAVGLGPKTPGQIRGMATAAACYPGQGGMKVLRTAVVTMAALLILLFAAPAVADGPPPPEVPERPAPRPKRAKKDKTPPAPLPDQPPRLPPPERL